VVSNEQVSNEQVSKERGIKWSWSQMKWSHTNSDSVTRVESPFHSKWLTLRKKVIRLEASYVFYRMTRVTIFFFWASCSYHCLAALNLEAGIVQPFDCLIVQNSQAVQSMGGRWIGQRRTTWSTVCTSAPHSQAAEEAGHGPTTLPSPYLTALAVHPVTNILK